MEKPKENIQIFTQEKGKSTTAFQSPKQHLTLSHQKLIEEFLCYPNCKVSISNFDKIFVTLSFNFTNSDEKTKPNMAIQGSIAQNKKLEPKTVSEIKQRNERDLPMKDDNRLFRQRITRNPKEQVVETRQWRQ